MASPPPGSGPLALPRQRPALALPGGGLSPTRPRKHSITSATSSSAHPLRQTSFPPPDSLELQHQLAEDRALAVYSPSGAGSHDDFSDGEIDSAISGPGNDGGGAIPHSGGRKRKRGRGERAPRGRPRGSGRRAGSASLANGEDGRKGGADGGDGGDADDDDGDEEEAAAGGGRVPLWEGGQMSAAEVAAENQQRAMFSERIGNLDALPLARRRGLARADHAARYEAFGRSKLRVADVRRLVNQTLSQSVPPNIITVVSSYTKLFAGMLVQGAREVQAEWEACEPRRADGSENPLHQRLARAQRAREEGNEGPEQSPEQKTTSADEKTTTADVKMGDGSGTDALVKREASSSPVPMDTVSQAEPDGNTTTADESQPVSKDASFEDSVYPGGAGGLSALLEECDRGPLQPDHLREALRRYKKARKGGTVGFTGLSLEGRDVAASRMGGRRLFR